MFSWGSRRPVFLNGVKKNIVIEILRMYIALRRQTLSGEESSQQYARLA